MLFCDFLQRNKIYSTSYNDFISDRQTDLMANLSLFISDQKKICSLFGKLSFDRPQ